MAFNSSSSNDHHPWYIICFFTRPASFLFTSFTIIKILLLLPLCIFIIYLGLQRWRHQRSTSAAGAAAAAMSHSDAFTYHMAAFELVTLLGHVLCCCDIHTENIGIFYAGFSLLVFCWCGEMSFHILTCVERYLAVVHPVTYLSLRGERGIRIRNISIGCVWLLSFGLTGFAFSQHFVLMTFCMFLISLTIISFCSLSVLLVLVRPGPGEQGGDRDRVDQSKRRAFYTILAILGLLVVQCCGNLLCLVALELKENDLCLLTAFEFFFNFPSSLVLPLLFLNRAGVLACCKNSVK